jgi:outer membrane protein assembly factor BamE
VAPIPSFSRRRSRRVAAAAGALAAMLVAGCATVDTYFPTLRSFGVYKLDINQGNYLSQDTVDRLRVGQNKTQVRQLLGTPLVVSAFRDNRWDYVYEFTRQGVVVEHRTFSVYFVDDKLARWEGDEMPVSVAELNKEAAARVAGEGAWTDERSWLDKFLDIFRK